MKGNYTKLLIGTNYIKPTLNRNTLYYTHSPQGFSGIWHTAGNPPVPYIIFSEVSLWWCSDTKKLSKDTHGSYHQSLFVSWNQINIKSCKRKKRELNFWQFIIWREKTILITVYDVWAFPPLQTVLFLQVIKFPEEVIGSLLNCNVALSNFLGTSFELRGWKFGSRS